MSGSPKGGAKPSLAQAFAEDPEVQAEVTRRRAVVNADLPASAGEVFFGWVQRPLVPGPGHEWCRIEIPRHVAEALAQPDRAGRKVRKDTREVMTMEILGELSSWSLGKPR